MTIVPSRILRNPSVRFAGLAAVIVLGAALRLWAYWKVGYPHDDAFITLRYAEHLASGLGPVFNPGERVLGATSPLFLFLCAILIRAGVPAILAANAIGWLAFTGTLIVAARLILRHLGYLPALFATSALAFNLYLHFVDAGGMETPLYQFLILLFFDRVLSGAAGWAVGLAAGLLIWTRPDALLFITPGIAFLFLTRDRRWIPTLILFALFFAALEFSMHAYYRVWVPNSVGVKYRIGSWIHEHRENPEYASGYAAIAKEIPQGFSGVFAPYFFTSPVEAVALILFLFALWRLYRLRRPLLLLPAALLLYLSAFAASHAILMPWYLTAAYPLLLILVGIGLAGVVERWPRFALAAGVTIALFALAFSPVLIRLVEKGNRDRAISREKSRLKQEAATWVYQLYGPEVRVASADVGYLGYYCRCRVLDLLGIVSPMPQEFWNPLLNNAKFEILHFKPRLGFYYSWAGNEPILTGHERPVRVFGEPGAPQISIYEYTYPPHRYLPERLKFSPGMIK